MTDSEARPIILVYKEIAPADLRKFLAQSNDSPSGGGARDLRFPAGAFRPIMEQLFTREVSGPQGRPIRVARITFIDSSGGLRTSSLEYWPATASRPSEDRIAKVHASPALGGRLPRQDRGRVFLLLIKWETGEVRCYYAYEHDLESSSQWRTDVRDAILSCVRDSDLVNLNRVKRKKSVQGYVDFRTGSTYCHD